MSDLEKQDLTPVVEPVPQESVLPRLHPSLDIMRAIQGGDLRATAILESFAYYGAEEDWQSVWLLADVLKREVSLLFDDQGLIWVDIGTVGMVRLSPPMGSRLPLRLWVHTHPWEAYWSATDKRTLATVSGILERALVLGHDHMVQTVHMDEAPEDCRLKSSGSLMNWSAEDAVTYAERGHP